MTLPVSALALAMAYALGSIPTGLWLGLRLRGIDIRQHGSKNIGATNTLRVLGKRLGVIALAADVSKGAVAVALGLLAQQYGSWSHLHVACGLAAIFGHSYSLFMKFRGGKGVATSCGVFLALAWQPTLCAAIAFLIVTGLTRMVSAGSIAAAITLCLAMFAFQMPSTMIWVAVAIAILVIVKHRSNIVRILQGRESKLGASSNSNS
jgi:glycerol-3-phosphate acyltransferase PlsY